MAPESPAVFLVPHAQAIARVYRRGRAADFGLDQTELGAALYSNVRAWNAAAEPAAIDEYLDALHAEDLVLALACARGIAPARERFTADYWPLLYLAARTLTHDENGARELANSLWIDLDGMAQAPERTPRPLLGDFNGRSSLRTWLRTVLAQRFADLTHAVAQNNPLMSRSAESAIEEDGADPDRVRYVSALNAALVAALGELDPRDRLRLSYYYLENLTLREVARLLIEHPSSVSRRLQQTRLELKRQVERRLRGEQHLSEEQIRLCYDYAAEQWSFDLSRALSESE